MDRGVQNVRRRQGYTRMTPRMIEQHIDMYRKEQGVLPTALTDIPDLHGLWSNHDGPPIDEWNQPIQYRNTGSSFELYSYGRDGQSDGIGLDADIFHDGRNKEQSLTSSIRPIMTRVISASTLTVSGRRVSVQARGTTWKSRNPADWK